MAIIIGTGEPISRVRRGLDIKGRVNLGLDETLVPVIEVGDYTGPPYRRSPVRWWIRTVVSGVALQKSGVRLANTSGRDQLLDRMIVRSTADIDVVVGSGLGVAPGAGTPARTTELVTVPANATGDISRPIPIEALGFTVTPSTIFDALLVFACGDLRGADLSVEIVLPATPRPDDPAQNVTTLTVETVADNTFLSMTFSGLYFDQLPLNALT